MQDQDYHFCVWHHNWGHGLLANYDRHQQNMTKDTTL